MNRTRAYLLAGAFVAGLVLLAGMLNGCGGNGTIQANPNEYDRWQWVIARPL